FFHEVADRAVAIAGCAFRRQHRLVNVELAPGKAAERLPDIVEGAVAFGLADQPGHGNRAGIDHRVEGLILTTEPDRVEGITRRLDADRAFDARGAKRVERESEYKRFRDRLDREGYAGVADLVDIAIEGREADAEMIGVRLG